MDPSTITYEIVLQEPLTTWLADWFEGARLEAVPSGRTRLRGELPDQAALHGLLERVRDLNLRLVSVQVRDLPQKGKTE